MDRIVIKSAEDMGKIIDWSKHYARFNGTSDFQMPFSSVEIEMIGELLKFTMKENGKFHDLVVYVPDNGGKGYIPCCGCSVSYANGITHSNISPDSLWYAGYDEAAKRQMRAVCKGANIIEKQLLKFSALMIFAVYYKEFRQIERVERTTVKSKKKSKGKSHKYLTSRKYVITQDFVERIPVKRNKCQYEFGVRGHYRMLRSGKRVWVKPHVRNAGKGIIDKPYIASCSDGMV